MESRYDAQTRLLLDASDKVNRVLELRRLRMVEQETRYTKMAKEQTKLAIADLREVMRGF